MDTTTWRCSARRLKCKARAITKVVNDIEFVRIKKNSHSHSQHYIDDIDLNNVNCIYE